MNDNLLEELTLTLPPEQHWCAVLVFSHAHVQTHMRAHIHGAFVYSCLFHVPGLILGWF